MKKISISVMAVLLAFGMVGCVDQSSGGEQTPAGVSPTSAVSGQPDETQALDPSAPEDDDDIDDYIEDPVIEVEASNETPAAALVGGLNAYKTMDMAEFDKYFEEGIASAIGVSEEPDETSINIHKLLYENLSWEARTESIEGEVAYVEVDISNKKTLQAEQIAAEKLLEEVGTDADAEAYAAKYPEYIKTAMADVESSERNILVTLKMIDGEWKISSENMPLLVAVRGISDDEIDETPSATTEQPASPQVTEEVQPTE